MASLFTRTIRLMEASTQTENVYGLQPIESKLEELQDKITSMNKKCKLHIFWVVFEERSKIIIS